ncbi:hypothetical protein GCM10010440_29870 [Kitasatospora cinereorecta]
MRLRLPELVHGHGGGWIDSLDVIEVCLLRRGLALPRHGMAVREPGQTRVIVSAGATLGRGRVWAPSDSVRRGSVVHGAITTR